MSALLPRSTEPPAAFEVALVPVDPRNTGSPCTFGVVRMPVEPRKVPAAASRSSKNLVCLSISSKRRLLSASLRCC